MHPDEFVQKLEELHDTIPDDNCLYIEGIPFYYTNLKASLEDAINFLSKQKPLSGIMYNRTITQACDYLLNELIIHDGLDDEESNKYDLEKRLNRFGEPIGEIYELIDYGMPDPEFIVINFILCDSDENKYERNVIFNPNIKCLGIAAAILPSEKICTVINFCEEFYEKNETIPLEVQMKYKKSTPQYNSKTIKNHPNQDIDNKKEEEIEEDNNLIKRTDSGKVFNFKKNNFIHRNEEVVEDKKETSYQKPPQRGGIINIPPKNIQDNNINEKKDENSNKTNLRDDRVLFRRKKTLHEPKNMEVIKEEKEENEEHPFDREFRIESSKTKPKIKKPEPKISNFSKNLNKSLKTTTTTKTETDKDGNKKTVTTTIREEVDGDDPFYENKFVKDIPFKSFGRKKFHDLDDEFDIEKEMRELEKDFDSEFRLMNLKSPIKPVFEPTDDMFENEDDIDIPDDAVSVEVKQKTVTDAKGKPVLILYKTITYENGEKKTLIERKNLVKK
jgi:hypothetical protein